MFDVDMKLVPGPCSLPPDDLPPRTVGARKRTARKVSKEAREEIARFMRVMIREAKVEREKMTKGGSK